ncbi:hypothetical protein [Halanaerobium sp.]|uniref:hypothetical protein n=1 Tax=Halanaerobium sp. TaxID=1895664 RepID=UPI0025BE7AFB|nr:hypothetical protein [Halanaerobium sp.]
MIRLNEIKTEVKQAEENFNRNKIIKLKKEAAELVYNLETAKLFKEIFPDLEDHDNQAEFVVEKLAKSLNEDDLYKLMKIYPNNYRISNVHRAILAKSDSLEDLAKLLSAVPKNNYVFHPARSKAVKYVKDLKTARDFKQLFPNLDDYNKEARDIYRKLKNKLNREELIKLSEIFKSQSFNGLDDLLLKKSENIDDVLDTINRYPNFKRYSPDYVRKTAYNFVKDRTSAEKFLAEFTEDNQFTERAKEYLKESPSAKKETFNKQKEINKNSKIKDNSKLDNNNDYKEKNIVDKKLNGEKEKDGYAKMVELESDIISGKRSEITAKKEAVKYVDSFKTADKFHNVFYKSINNNDVDSIINNLKDDLNTTEIKKLITIFSDFPAVSTLIYEYLDRSKNLDQMIKAAKEFKDYKYQATAGRKALKYVNSLDSAVKYKNNFYEYAARSNGPANSQLYEIVKANLNNSKSIDGAIKITKDFRDVFSIIKMREQVISLVNTKDKLLKFVNYYPLENLKIDKVLSQLSKTELFEVAKNFKINKIQSAARQRYFNQSISYLEYRNIINYFPEYKNETVNIVLNSINNIDQAVKAKNAIPELKTEIRKQALDHVDDLYSAKLYNDNFLVNNDKLKVIKKLMKTLSHDDLEKLLDEYKVFTDREKIYRLHQKYHKINEQYIKISSKNTEFNIQGQLKDRSEDVLYLRGRSSPVNAALSTYGTLLDESNIYIINYNQDKLKDNFYLSKGHYLIEKRMGKNYFGQNVPVWIYGDKPEKLSKIEKRLSEINEQINRL